jgi:acetyl esterase/lipase
MPKRPPLRRWWGRLRRRSLLVPALVILVASVVPACGWFDDGAGAPPTSLPPPAERDIPYGDAAGCGPGREDDECGGSQQLDIYRSEGEGPNPVLMWIHGGGFGEGDKTGTVPGSLQAVLDDGWDIVAVNYRLTTPDGQNEFPAALHDVKQAVRWVKANAEDQDWDPTSVAAMGHSAGGNLAGMVGTTTGDPPLEPAGLPAELEEVDSSIVGVVAIAPVSDIAMFAGSLDPRPAQLYVGCESGCEEPFALASVQTHVDEESVHMLAVHGVDDELAAPAQGELVQQAYETAGIEDRFEMIVVDDGPEQHRGHDPDLERWIDDILDLLERARTGS